MDFNPYEILEKNGLPYAGSSPIFPPCCPNEDPLFQRISFELSSAAHELIREYFTFHDSCEYFTRKVENLSAIRDVISDSFASGKLDKLSVKAGLSTLQRDVSVEHSPEDHTSQFLIARLIDITERHLPAITQSDAISKHIDAVLSLHAERQSQFAKNAEKTFKAGLADLVEDDFDFPSLIQDSSAVIASLGCLTTGILTGLHALNYTSADMTDVRVAIILTATSIAVHAFGEPIASLVSLCKETNNVSTSADTIAAETSCQNKKNGFMPR